jgi:hypothetical protein
LQTLFAKAAWEVYEEPLERFIPRCHAEKWSATEIFLAARPEKPADILELHKSHDLKLIAQIITSGATVHEHLESLREHYVRALDCHPIAVNCHTGRDIFSFDENRRLFEAAVALSLREGVPLLHETHRGRALFTAPLCLAYLRAIPGLRLTADFSHLLCVHESTLEDQPEAVAAIIEASDHIHARVGFPEGPQLSDPRNPAYREWVDLSIEFWTRIRRRMTNEQRATMTITPEFGPPFYAPLAKSSPDPLADPWSSNRWIREELTRRWQIGRTR